MSPNPGRALAGLVAVLLLAASCGTSNAAEDETGIATLSDPSIGAAGDESTNESASDALEAPENPEDAFLLFDKCMAEEGFDFESTGGSGGLGVEPSDESNATGSDPQSSEQAAGDLDFDKFTEANDKCAPHLRNIDTGFDMTPEQEAALDDAELAWRKCMEDQGVDVPDFGEGGSGFIAIGGTNEETDPQGGAGLDDADFDFEAFDEASEQCQSVFDEVQNIDGASGESDR